MTILDLSKIIRELISSRMERVELPGFGSFVVVETHSEFVNDGMAITPPCTKIVFESSFDNNDTLFAEKYAKLKSISVASAKNEVASFLSSLKRELVECTELVIPQFGTICFGEKGSFVFQPEPAFDFEADSYCLEIISLKVRSSVESSVSADADDQQGLEMAELDIELVDEQMEQTGEDGIAEIVECEDAERAESAEALKVVEETTEKQQPEEEHPEQEQPEEHKLQELQQPQEQKSPTAPVQRQKRNWVLWGVLAAVGVIIVMVVLLFVFREQLMPLLEQLLYSEEELEILRQFNI
jgi:nucleoid DNA-binding protein